MRETAGQNHRQGMRRWQTLNSFIDHGWSDGGFTHAEVHVWMAIFRKVGKEHRVEFSIRSIADDAGVTRKVAERAVEKMVNLKYLRRGFVSRRPHAPSGYYFLPEPEAGERQAVYKQLTSLRGRPPQGDRPSP